MEGLFGRLSSRRLALVDQAFDRVRQFSSDRSSARGGDGGRGGGGSNSRASHSSPSSVLLDDVVDAFDATAHPDVKAGKRSGVSWRRTPAHLYR